MYFDFVVSVK